VINSENANGGIPLSLCVVSSPVHSALVINLFLNSLLERL
jgi:hypothetical protein